MIQRSPRRRRTKSPTIHCPWCGSKIDRPRQTLEVFSSDGARGGRCTCGAAFVLDETGRSGGQCVLDVLALLCDGDLDRALALDSGTDYRMKTLPYVRFATSVARNWRVTPSRQPKIWFAAFPEDQAGE